MPEVRVTFCQCSCKVKTRREGLVFFCGIGMTAGSDPALSNAFIRSSPELFMAQKTFQQEVHNLYTTFSKGSKLSENLGPWLFRAIFSERYWRDGVKQSITRPFSSRLISKAICA